MKVLHFSKSGAFRDEQWSTKKYSNIRSYITNFSEIAKLAGADDIYTWHPSDKDIKPYSDLHLINDIYGYEYKNADQHEMYDILLASMLRFPFGSMENLYSAISEFEVALSHSKGYIYFDYDRECDTHDYVKNKEAQYLPWLAKQEPWYEGNRKLRALVTNSWSNVKILQDNFPNTNVIYLPILNYRENNLLTKYNVNFSDKVYDFSTMKSLKDWESVINNTNLSIKTKILLLDNTGMLRNQISRLENYSDNLEVISKYLIVGAHISTISEHISKVKVLTPAGNPKVAKFDLHSVKLTEAYWGGSLLPIHKNNPHFNELMSGLSYKLSYDSDLTSLDFILDYTQNVDASTYESDVSKFRTNIDNTFHPDKWKSTFQDIVSNI